MNRCVIPKGYKASLNLYDTQVAIAMTKRVFEDTLSGALNLRRVRTASAGCLHWFE